MLKEHNLLEGFEVDVLGRESYDYFKKNKKFNSKQTDDYYKWRRILTSFLMYFKELLIFSNKGFYIRGIGYFYFEPYGKTYKRMRFRKIEKNIRYILKFIPDLQTFSNWQIDNFKMVSEDIKICDLSGVEFLKAQKLNDGIYINKRALSRGRK